MVSGVAAVTVSAGEGLALAPGAVSSSVPGHTGQAAAEATAQAGQGGHCSLVGSMGACGPYTTVMA